MTRDTTRASQDDPGANPPGDETLPHVVVIGGGFCGAAFVVHLLRDHPELHCRLTVIEPQERLGAGLAYGTRDPEHRVNVAAARMTLFNEIPSDFHDWLLEHGGADNDPRAQLADGRLFPQRGRFGDYVAHTLGTLVAGAARRVAFRHLHRRAFDVRRGAEGKLHITLSDDSTLVADLLVLAVGHPPPAVPSFLRGVPDTQVITDPWADQAFTTVPPAAHVLVVGTGLTGADVVASLAARDHAGPITLLSRHGLLPRPRTGQTVEAFGDYATDPARTALALLRRIRADIAATRALGRPWEDVIDALRRDSPVLWAALPLIEKRRLLRHARAFWDVHRFQAAPQIDATLGRLRESGQLQLLAGQVESVAPAPSRLRVNWHPRGKADCETFIVDRVVNCTGPGHRSVVSVNPVLRAMAANGLVAADRLGLGLEVGADDHPLDAMGEVVRGIYVAGPLARSAHGELMGIPQVSTQPRAIANRVAREVAASAARREPVTPA